ncbi:MAG: response regulator transcription factor [Bacteroidota bacterium]|nr:response regulator transcription factor [Bacteroidota bacterium]
MRVLIVEDEKKVAAFIKNGLESEGYVTDIACDGRVGLEKAFDESYDIIILDLMIPEIDGLTLLQKIRKEKISTQVIILTARGQVEDRIEGLNKGADDYLVKPFAFDELLARIRALYRRIHPQKESVFNFDDLTIDIIERKVIRGKKQIDLSAKEYSLLEFMAYNKNRALNRTTISEHVWNYDFDRGTNFIDVYINRLRKKIDNGFDKTFIHTVRGYGYMFKT